MAAQHGVESEGAAGFGEEPLGPRLTAQATAQQMGRKSSVDSDRGKPWRAKSRWPEALGAVLEEDHEDVSRPHEVDSSATKVGDVVGQAEVGEVGDRIRDAGPPCRPDEDAPFEPGRQGGGDPVGPEGGHRSACLGRAIRPRSTPRPVEPAGTVEIGQRRRVEARVAGHDAGRSQLTVVGSLPGGTVETGGEGAPRGGLVPRSRARPGACRPGPAAPDPRSGGPGWPRPRRSGARIRRPPGRRRANREPRSPPRLGGHDDGQSRRRPGRQPRRGSPFPVLW